MSAAEWKPGDVASWEFGNRDPLIALHVGPCRDDAHPERPHWHLVNGGWSATDQYARPLVVLDPESDEDVRRLHAAYYAAMQTLPESRQLGWDTMQAALRELANPTRPKPDEPTGLGAVVETRDGELYVRDKTTTTVAHWKRARGMERGERHRYSDLPVVRVLSEGVVPE